MIKGEGLDRIIKSKSRVGLAVMRIQPLHKGHTRIINKMIEDYKTVILAIGSTQKSRERWDPWTFEERKQMVRNVYGDRLKIVQLQDLGTSENTDAWVEYVLDKIQKLGMAPPTDYYTGSQADARWYKNRFFMEGVSEWDSSDPFSSKMREFNARYYIDGFLREVHIVDRAKNPVPPATDLRTFMELRSDDWKPWVPAVNWELIEATFPEEFKVKQ